MTRSTDRVDGVCDAARRPAGNGDEIAYGGGGVRVQYVQYFRRWEMAGFEPQPLCRVLRREREGCGL